ncbi:MAG: helix-turn-helix transcriptional regulator [Bacteroidetes bacterium]|nr:helix-turn-helix transcriptional regulator [Bacteroidota bacterium]MBP7478168.1 helix-turn-helix transcriptional regulator [Chitinophagales bacterium]
MKSKIQDIVVKKNAKETIKIDYNTLRKSVLTLRAINHPLRKEMIQKVEEKQKMTVTELYVGLKLEQSVASQHLAILRKAGVLSTTRDGKFIFYTVNKERLEEISNLVVELAKHSN